MSGPKSTSTKDCNIVTVTCTSDNESIGDNKVIAQSIEIADAFAGPGGTAKIVSVTLLDQTTTGPAVDLLFSKTNSAITQDEGKAIGEDVDNLDTVFTNMQGHVSIVASDWTDMHDSKLASKTNIQLVCEGHRGDSSLYCHVINRSGSNYTTGGTDVLRLKVGIERN